MSLRLFSSSLSLLLSSRSSLSPSSLSRLSAPLVCYSSLSHPRSWSSFRLQPATQPLLISQCPLETPFRRFYKPKLPEVGTPEYWDVAKKFNPDRIREKRLDLIGPDGEKLGIKTLYDAVYMATQQNCLLRAVDPDSKPFRARLLRRERKSKKNEIVIKDKVKEIRFSHRITENDAQTKTKKILKLLKTRHRVKLVIFYPSKKDFDANIAHNMLDYINNLIPETAGYLDQGKYFDERDNSYCFLLPVATTDELGNARAQQEVEIVQVRRKGEESEESEEEEEQDEPYHMRKDVVKDQQFYRSGGRHSGVLDDRLDEKYFMQRSATTPPKGGYKAQVARQEPDQAYLQGRNQSLKALRRRRREKEKQARKNRSKSPTPMP